MTLSVSWLFCACVWGKPDKAAKLPTWIASAGNQKRVLCLGEQDTHMGKPNLLKLIVTMLTNKAVGE